MDTNFKKRLPMRPTFKSFWAIFNDTLGSKMSFVVKKIIDWLVFSGRRCPKGCFWDWNTRNWYSFLKLTKFHFKKNKKFNVMGPSECKISQNRLITTKNQEIWRKFQNSFNGLEALPMRPSLVSHIQWHLSHIEWCLKWVLLKRF